MEFDALWLRTRAIAVHPLFEKASGLTGEIIAAAIEVHKDKGAGLIEGIYECCLGCEFDIRGLAFRNQKGVLISYKGRTREEILRFDLLVEECILIEIKVVESVIPIHKAQLLSYMKLLDAPLGLLISFHVVKLTDGVSRLMLPGANVQ